MRIGIMCSLAFAKEVSEIRDELERAGHTVSLPFTVEHILDGKITVREIEEMKRKRIFAERAKRLDLIRWNWERMQNDDAVLVVNLEKNGTKNYIGANTFLEIGFAHVLKKKIFLWCDLPDLDFYRDELVAMSPIALRQDIAKIE